MDPIAVDGHRVVLILIRVNDVGEVLGDDQHAMRTGEAHWDGETLWLDWGDSEPPYALDPGSSESSRWPQENWLMKRVRPSI